MARPQLRADGLVAGLRCAASSCSAYVHSRALLNNHGKLKHRKRRQHNERCVGTCGRGCRHIRLRAHAVADFGADHTSKSVYVYHKHSLCCCCGWAQPQEARTLRHSTAAAGQSRGCVYAQIALDVPASLSLVPEHTQHTHARTHARSQRVSIRFHYHATTQYASVHI